MIPVRCKAGDLVEVRAAEEVLATLDEKGCLDGMPFMPEMLEFCGRQFRVFRSAHKTCDSIYYKDGRILDHTVFLEDLRCNGAGHGGCQANCLIFFSLYWLRPVSPRRDWRLPERPPAAAGRDAAWLRGTARSEDAQGQVTYRCQTTEHLRASRIFRPFDPGVFLADLRSRNVSLPELARALLLLVTWHVQRNVRTGWRLWTGIYSGLHRLFYGTESPHIYGTIPKGAATPQVSTGLKEGELVRVRSLAEIQPTLNVANRNRGLSFNPEMAPSCGHVFRVQRRVTTIIDEKTGRMLDIKNPCIMLEGVYCMARYHPEALLCPKRIPQYFREAWLERVDEPHVDEPK